MKKFLLPILCVMLCLSLVMPVSAQGAEDFQQEAVSKLREGMIQRQPQVEIVFESEQWIFSAEAMAGDENAQKLLDAEAAKLMHNIYEQALTHTGAGNQGDYLQWHIGKYQKKMQLSYRGDGTQGVYTYTITYRLTYYTTAQQEQAVTEKIQSVLSQLDLAGKTEYEKIRAIYDYICTHVVYDNKNLNNDGYVLKYSAYAALINGTSVCQGYSNLFYRMALEAGIDSRIIIGKSNGGNHSWNLVKLEGVYYYLDCTWDAGMENYQFFLKTKKNMTDHDESGEDGQAAMLAGYPMAKTDYPVPVETPPETQPTTPPTTAPTTPPTTAPTTPPTTAPTTPPTTAPTTPPTTAPTTPPTTAPTTPPTTAPTTPPTTAPTTPPTTAPTTPPTTAPTTPPTTAPTTPPTTPPTTAPTTLPDTTAGTTVIQQPTTKPAIQPEKDPDGNGMLLVGGLVLLAAAVGGAALLAKKRK